MGGRASGKRMEAVDVQSARLQGELSTVIQSAAGDCSIAGRTSIGRQGRAAPRKLDSQGVATTCSGLVPCASLLCPVVP